MSARPILILGLACAIAVVAVVWPRREAAVPPTRAPRSLELVDASAPRSAPVLSESATSTPVAPNDGATDAAILPARAADELPPALLAALGEWDPERRGPRIEAALRAWAEHDVDAAGNWAQSQSFIPRAVALAAVVNGGAAGDADRAERFVAALSSAAPAQADEYHGFLIFALGEIGAHARAAAWATKEESADSGLFALAYSRWATSDPSAAWSAAGKIPDDYRRHTATRAALNAWAKTQPLQLAELAEGWPDGSEKSFALVAAMRAWAEREPERAAAWMVAHPHAFVGVPRPETILED